MLLGLTVLLALSGGCRTGRLKYDGAALKTIQRVAVIMYTVPVKVGFSEKPGRQKGKRLLLRMTDSETADNGMLAATQAQASFIEEFNLSDLEFKAISQSEMFGNQEFMQLAGEVLKEQQERLAEARAEDEKTTTGQTKQMLEVFSRASGQRQETAGVGPRGIPNWGLPPEWLKTTSALVGGEEEMSFIKDAIAILGVDAALVISDPGMSFTCRQCPGGTGRASTGSAFLATLVGADGRVILEMRQTFAFNGLTAPIKAYRISQSDYLRLFYGHGKLMARVFTVYFRLKGEKKPEPEPQPAELTEGQLPEGQLPEMGSATDEGDAAGRLPERPQAGQPQVDNGPGVDGQPENQAVPGESPDQGVTTPVVP